MNVHLPQVHRAGFFRPLFVLAAGLLLLGAAPLAAWAQGSAATQPAAVPLEFVRMSILDIIRNPPASGTKVSTYGTVDTNITAQTGVASVYFIKGDEGGTIEVQSFDARPPLPLTRKDPLRGTVNYKVGSGGTPEPYLVEAPQWSNDETPEQRAERLRREAEARLASQREFYLRISLIGVGVILVVVVLLLVLKFVKPLRIGGELSVAAPPASGSEADKTVATRPAANEDYEITIRRDSSTVSVADDEKTIYVFPGHLVVRSGANAGTKIPLCYMAQPNERIANANMFKIEIGRRSAQRPKGPNFIGLEADKTLSRDQASIVYDRQADRILIEHRSSAANPTTVDGRPLGPDETVTLKPGMVIGIPGDYALEFCPGKYVARRN